MVKSDEKGSKLLMSNRAEGVARKGVIQRRIQSHDVSHKENP